MEETGQFAPQPMYGSVPEEEVQPQKAKPTSSFKANLLPIGLFDGLLLEP